LFGGRLEKMVQLCEKTRKEAYDAMMINAQKMGANAIVGFR
jgi:uncharacterized protein YbjQ (UPF0145 family)